MTWDLGEASGLVGEDLGVGQWTGGYWLGGEQVDWRVVAWGEASGLVGGGLGGSQWIVGWYLGGRPVGWWVMT